MKNFPLVAVLAALTCPFLMAKSADAKRGPMISPSVKAAARLKYSPPRNWIRHYLGDDRYKIAGGIWKVVTTPNDKFYYPAYAAEMLRRSPNNVIGFSSADEAIEAGYVAHPSYFQSGVFAATTEVSSQNTRTTTRRSVAQRVGLSDRASSLILPAGWRRTDSRSQNVQGMTLNMDEFRSPRGAAVGVVTMTMPNMPAGMDIGKFMTPETMRQYSSGFGAGVVTNRANNVFQDVAMRRIKLGGLRGIGMKPRSKSGLAANQIGEAFMVGRGSKMYIIVTQGATRSAETRTILNSFRPR